MAKKSVSITISMTKWRLMTKYISIMEKLEREWLKRKIRKLRSLTLTSGVIEDGKGVNIPNKHLSVPTFPEKDLEIIRFAKKHDVEYVALSFTRNAEDVKNLSQTNSFEGGIIAKIETL